MNGGSGWVRCSRQSSAQTSAIAAPSSCRGACAGAFRWAACPGSNRAPTARPRSRDAHGLRKALLHPRESSRFMPTSLGAVRALLTLSALLGCTARASQPLPQPRLPSAVASASPRVEPPVSAAAPLLGDAEAVLRARLASAPPEQGLELFFQTFRAREVICNSKRFSAIHSAGTSFTRSSESVPPSVLGGGSIESIRTHGLRDAVHGLSSTSLLIDGSEWFFSRSDCVRNPQRYPPATVSSEPDGVDVGELITWRGEP